MNKEQLINAILDNADLQAYVLAEATRTLGRPVNGDEDEEHYEAQTQVLEVVLTGAMQALRPPRKAN